MKKIYLSGLLSLGLLFLVIFSALSQKDKFKYGKVTAEDLKRTPENDSTAGAVVLFDVGKSYFLTNPGGIQLVFERHTKIQILSKSGYEWANGSIGLYYKNGTQESLSNFHAATYNLEGGKVVISELKKDGIFDDKVIDYYSYKKFAMPNVKEGSIIEYKYKIYSDLIFNIRPWSFQRNIPVQYSEYEVEIPEFFHFKKEMKGYENIRTDIERSNRSFFHGTSSNVETYTLMGENLPAFKEEAYLSCADNYKSSINFEISTVLPPGQIPIRLITDWAQIGRGLIEDESFGKILNKKNTVDELVDSLTLNLKTPQEKIKAIYDYVRLNLKWNEEKGIFASQKIKKTLEDKSGNVADINLLTVLMLKTAGLSADPVIISTRDHGIVYPYFAPILSKFNYVIAQVKVDSKNYLIDATDKWRAYDVLPLRCLNGVGRVFYEDHSGWVELKNNESGFQYDVLKFSLSEDGLLKGEINISRKSYSAFLARNSLGQVSYDNYVEEEKKARENWEINEIKHENQEKLRDVFVEKYDVTINNMVSRAGDKMYLEPMIISKIAENPFKMENRKYPVDYGYPTSQAYHCSIKLPEGYKLEQPLPPVIASLPGKGGRFMFEVVETNGILQIKSNFMITKTIFLPEEYQNLRAFYNYVITKQSEQIVLTKL